MNGFPVVGINSANPKTAISQRAQLKVSVTLSGDLLEDPKGDFNNGKALNVKDPCGKFEENRPSKYSNGKKANLNDYFIKC